MRYSICLFVLCVCTRSSAQSGIQKPSKLSYTGSEKYVSFNPFGLLEGGMTIGGSFGNRFSERSEYFSELSYIGKNPLYNEYVNSMHGFRLITQYRYHFLQQWRPILSIGFQKRRARTKPFAGLEFRIKEYNFSSTNSFVNHATNDTINNYSYKANATCLGGTVIFGATHNIGSSGNWKIEITAGLGAKQKLVRFKNIPTGYKPVIVRAIDWGFPRIYESVNSPYVPFAIRLRYVIN